MRTLWFPLICLALGAGLIWGARTLGLARQGQLSSGPFWADVTILALAGLACVAIGAMWLAIRLVALIRR